MSDILMLFSLKYTRFNAVFLMYDTHEGTDTQVTVMSTVSWLIKSRPWHQIHACLLQNLILSLQKYGLISVG